MTRPDPFPETDADLFAYIRGRANEKPIVAWETIADDLGVAVRDLLDWFLAYREPKHDKRQLTIRRSAPALLPGPHNHDHWTKSHKAQAFENWRRAHAGAVEARRR